jgi:hypothetical protein
MSDHPAVRARSRSRRRAPLRSQAGRRLVTFVIAGVCTFLLAGCVQLRGNFQVSSNNTVSGDARIGVQKSVVALAGGANSFYSQLEGSNGCSGGHSGTNTTQSRYDDGTYIGVVCTFHDEPISRFSEGSDSGDQLSLTRAGDQFHLSGTLDIAGSITSNLGSGEASSLPSSFPSLDPQAMLKSADIQFVFQFPGRVRSASGQIDGNTVTFKPDPSGKLVLNATADATPSSNGGLPVSAWVGIGVAILAVVALVLFLITRRPRSAVAATASAGPANGDVGPRPAGGYDTSAYPPYQQPPSGYEPPEYPGPPSSYEPPPPSQPPTDAR